jgi:hypothetical protein
MTSDGDGRLDLLKQYLYNPVDNEYTCTCEYCLEVSTKDSNCTSIYTEMISSSYTPVQTDVQTLTLEDVSSIGFATFQKGGYIHANLTDVANAKIVGSNWLIKYRWDDNPEIIDCTQKWPGDNPVTSAIVVTRTDTKLVQWVNNTYYIGCTKEGKTYDSLLAAISRIVSNDCDISEIVRAGRWQDQKNALESFLCSPYNKLCRENARVVDYAILDSCGYIYRQEANVCVGERFTWLMQCPSQSETSDGVALVVRIQTSMNYIYHFPNKPGFYSVDKPDVSLSLVAAICKAVQDIGGDNAMFQLQTPQESLEDEKNAVSQRDEGNTSEGSGDDSVSSKEEGGNRCSDDEGDEDDNDYDEGDSSSDEGDEGDEGDSHRCSTAFYAPYNPCKQVINTTT